MEKQEIINLIIKLLWIAKKGNIFSLTFNGNSVIIFDQVGLTAVDLNMIINRENYTNIMNILYSASSCIRNNFTQCAQKDTWSIELYGNSLVYVVLPLVLKNNTSIT
ncbi:2397_t:CDS:2 [Scutellospora calospora]|uniref:2397_t:CDS:1 n=1 Tax=Scutellospora calospora TaxID=85575 RepID=A0ACA9K1Y3_9GLOM|nr:2397_t:CDS:2 [Scutellospora calospora]